MEAPTTCPQPGSAIPRISSNRSDGFELISLMSIDIRIYGPKKSSRPITSRLSVAYRPLVAGIRDATIGQPVRQTLRPSLQGCQFGPVSHVEAMAAAGEDVGLHKNLGLTVRLEQFYGRAGAARIVIR